MKNTPSLRGTIPTQVKSCAEIKVALLERPEDEKETLYRVCFDMNPLCIENVKVDSPKAMGFSFSADDSDEDGEDDDDYDDDDDSDLDDDDDDDDDDDLDDDEDDEDEDDDS